MMETDRRRLVLGPALGLAASALGLWPGRAAGVDPAMKASRHDATLILSIHQLIEQDQIYFALEARLFRIPLLDTMRERAKSVIADAKSLVEKHGKAADEIAREYERNANGLGDTFYWRAVRKVVATKIESALNVLPPAQANNCTACLVERIAGTHEGEGPSGLLACVSCVGQAVGQRLERQQELSQKADNCATCLVERAAATREREGLPLPLACVSRAANSINQFLHGLGSQELSQSAVWPADDPRQPALLQEGPRRSVDRDASEGMGGARPSGQAR